MICGIQAAQKSLNLRLPCFAQHLATYVHAVRVREARQLSEAREQPVEHRSKPRTPVGIRRVARLAALEKIVSLHDRDNHHVGVEYLKRARRQIRVLTRARSGHAEVCNFDVLPQLPQPRFQYFRPGLLDVETPTISEGISDYSDAPGARFRTAEVAIAETQVIDAR